LPATPRTTPTRLAERVRHDRDPVHRILDEALVCHLGFTVDGEPRILPTLHVRDGDTLYLHGSTGSRPTRNWPRPRCWRCRWPSRPRRYASARRPRTPKTSPSGTGAAYCRCGWWRDRPSRSTARRRCPRTCTATAATTPAGPPVTGPR